MWKKAFGNGVTNREDIADAYVNYFAKMYGSSIGMSLKD